MKRTILVIEADEIRYGLLNNCLADLNYSNDSIHRCASLEASLSITTHHIDIILANLSLSDTDSLSALRMLQSYFINIPVIVLPDNTGARISATHTSAHGLLVYGSYDAAQLKDAIFRAKEQAALMQNGKSTVADYRGNVHLHTDHLESILFSINDAIWARNADTMELTYANNAYYKLYGYQQEDISKDILYDSIYAADREKFHASIDELRTTGKTDVTYRYTHNDGSVKTLKASATLRKGSDGRPDTISGITVDISKEKELHETIRDTEQKLLATINNTKDLIWSVNTKLEIIFCNKPYKDFIFSLGGVIPQEGTFVLGDWGSESFINSRTKDYERALQGESFITIVEEMHKGQVLYNEISSSPIIDHNGHIVGVNCIARDISQQKKQFFKIREQNEKLREIAWIQSHKVRGPVSSILGLASLFDYGAASAEYNMDILERLKEATNSLDKVIKEVVDTTIDVDYIYTDVDIISSQK